MTQKPIPKWIMAGRESPSVHEAGSEEDPCEEDPRNDDSKKDLAEDRANMAIVEISNLRDMQVGENVETSEPSQEWKLVYKEEKNDDTNEWIEVGRRVTKRSQNEANPGVKIDSLRTEDSTDDGTNYWSALEQEELSESDG